jgi:hypothetical protein
MFRQNFLQTLLGNCPKAPENGTLWSVLNLLKFCGQQSLMPGTTIQLGDKLQLKYCKIKILFFTYNMNELCQMAAVGCVSTFCPSAIPVRIQLDHFGRFIGQSKENIWHTIEHFLQCQINLAKY